MDVDISKCPIKPFKWRWLKRHKLEQIDNILRRINHDSYWSYGIHKIGKDSYILYRENNKKIEFWDWDMWVSYKTAHSIKPIYRKLWKKVNSNIRDYNQYLEQRELDRKFEAARNVL